MCNVWMRNVWIKRPMTQICDRKKGKQINKEKFDQTLQHLF